MGLARLVVRRGTPQPRVMGGPPLGAGQRARRLPGRESGASV